MPFYLQKFVDCREKPATVTPNENIIKALQIMKDHDFDQLPVVDKENKPLGLINYESILRCLTFLNIKPENMHASDVILKTRHFKLDDDIFDLLNELKKSNAVLIVDANGKLMDIFTSYDAMDYLRQHFDDFMIVEDIELSIKGLILAAFRNKDGVVDEEALSRQVRKIRFDLSDLKPKYLKALKSYMEQIKRAEDFNDGLAVETFNHFTDEKSKAFHELTFNDYAMLLLSEEVWGSYQTIVQLDVNAIRTMFDSARDARNILAHFQGELTSENRQKIRDCKNWLNIQMELIHQAQPVLVETEEEVIQVGNGKIEPAEETSSLAESRYEPFYEWLLNQPLDADHVILTFNEIEKIIGDNLPESAGAWKNWWANDTTSHPQSILWLDAGWRSTYINLSEERVTFARIRAREKDYIHFFNHQLIEIKKYPDFPLKEYNPDGRSWLTVSGLLQESPQVVTYNFAFAFGKRYRVEIYINSGDQNKNKEIFDLTFAHMDEIVKNFGIPLIWERLDEKRASRIAYYQPGHIGMEKEKLNVLAQTSAKLMDRYYQSTSGILTEAIKKVLKH